MNDGDGIRSDLRELASALVRLRVRLLAQRAAEASYTLDALLQHTEEMTTILTDSIEAAWGDEAAFALAQGDDAMEASDETA